ncbi:hypothetical protein M0R45_012183 [Rubus argutus]|uniref:Gamma-glutamylcyclotransferase n=1 Tax=Rubus argutus TaxID=59490 RepID=A0AAW1YF31_RUBAR
MVFWVFGYGSLVWNPGFEYDEKVIGCIKDYRRVFDLACIDHRGTPEHPARTCTLEHKEGAVCWGAAYSVRGGPEKERLAMEYLERRECEYDAKTLVNFYKAFFDRSHCFHIYSRQRIKQVLLGSCPIGGYGKTNCNCFWAMWKQQRLLFLLEKAMFDIGNEEDYVIELANEVRNVLGIVGKGIPKDKKLTGPTHIPLKSHIPAIQLHPLPEAIAIAMDS